MQSITVRKTHKKRQYEVIRHGKVIGILFWNPVRDAWELETPDFIQLSRNPSIRNALEVLK